MKDPTSVIWRCTIQRRDGSFCDMPGMADMPHPICRAHAEAIHDRFAEHRGQREIFLRDALASARNGLDPAHEDYLRRRDEATQAQSQVYYVRTGDHVKIGYSVNLAQRLTALRLHPDAVLATEPGGRELERQRHLEFADERVGRREDFNPSRRLLAHIEAVREEHGPPRITTWPKVS